MPSAGVPRRTPAGKKADGKVVPLRPGDLSRPKKMRCRHCGGEWFDAVISIDRDHPPRPIGVHVVGGYAPAPKCHDCGREALL